MDSIKYMEINDLKVFNKQDLNNIWIIIKIEFDTIYLLCSCPKLNDNYKKVLIKDEIGFKYELECIIDGFHAIVENKFLIGVLYDRSELKLADILEISNTIQSESLKFHWPIKNNIASSINRTNRDVIVAQYSDNQKVVEKTKSDLKFEIFSNRISRFNGKIESVTPYKFGAIVSVAEKNKSLLYILDPLTFQMTSLDISINFFISRILCIGSCIIIASEEGFITMYNIKSKNWSWKFYFENKILDMESFHDDTKIPRLYVALSNGSIGIIHNPKNENASCTIKYILSKQRPIQKLLLRSQNNVTHLLCASYDTIIVLDILSSLKVVKQFKIIKNEPNFDPVQYIIEHMVLWDNKLMITFRKSTQIQLWNIDNVQLILNTDISHYNIHELEGMSVDRTKIMGKISAVCFLENDHNYWIGTDDGEILNFDLIYQVTRFIDDEVACFKCSSSVFDTVNTYIDTCHDSSSNQNTATEYSSTHVKPYLELEGCMQLSDSPIQFLLPIKKECGRIEERFVAISTYFNELNSVVLWKYTLSGWKYKSMQLVRGIYRRISDWFIKLKI